MNFIGSVAGGRKVHAAAGGTFTMVHLELGGKDPTYIRADADTAAVGLLKQVEAGTVYLNRCDHSDLHMPWGGVKDSGLGRSNGGVGLASATAEKSFHIRPLVV